MFSQPALQAGPVVDSTAVGAATPRSANHHKLPWTTTGTGMKRQQNSGNNAVPGLTWTSSALVAGFAVSAGNRYRFYSQPYVAEPLCSAATGRTIDRAQRSPVPTARKTENG